MASTAMSPPWLLQSQTRTPPSPLSFSAHIPTHTFLASRFTHLSISKPPPSTTIRMGGGPRTYPGGVSKWQWKRMQAKKAKQLLRARLARERQVYEMRKRAELAAAVSELERPWEVVDKAPKLFSVTADEQLKVLADRFQKPGGFDLWSEKDGPQLFETVEGLPSARFFPKGVVHSIKPYGRVTDGNSDESDRGLDYEHNEDRDYVKNSGNANGRPGKLDGRRGIRTGLGSGRDGLDKRENGSNRRKESKREKLRVFDMNMQDDGSYAVSKKEAEIGKSRGNEKTTVVVN